MSLLTQNKSADNQYTINKSFVYLSAYLNYDLLDRMDYLYSTRDLIFIYISDLFYVGYTCE